MLKLYPLDADRDARQRYEPMGQLSSTAQFEETVAHRRWQLQYEDYRNCIRRSPVLNGALHIV
jgi:hypothetical protein